MNVQIDTRNGLYEIHKTNTDYRITLDGVDKHGSCTADDVISFLSNALFNAEFMLARAERKAKGA